MNKYTENELNFIKENYLNMKAIDIANILNRPLSSVQDKIYKIGLSKEGAQFAKWADWQIQYLKENYSEKTYKEMSEYIGKTEKAIKVKAHKLGLKKNPFYYNKNSFSSIKTEEDAYWLGFMFADGYVIERKDGSKYYGIELSIRDIDHLKKFNKYLNGNLTIYTRTRSHVYEGREINSTNCSIVVNDADAAQNLINLGCVPRKSFIVKFPTKIDGCLMRHFVRGYFDGNGSISMYDRIDTKNYVRTLISCASKEFLDSLHIILKNKNINNCIVKDGNAYRMVISSKSARNLLKYMYDDCNIYLDRKYFKYINEILPTFTEM